jgi:hypothetical protein
MALAALKHASTIEFIGYSLPVTDFHAEFLFRQSQPVEATGNSSFKVTVVARKATKELLPRYENVFGEGRVKTLDQTFLQYAEAHLK